MSLSDWSHSATHTPSVILSDRPEPKFGKKDLECCFSRKLVRVQNGNISLFVYLSLKKPWYIHIHTLFNLVVRVAKASPLIHPLFISPGHVPTTRVWLQFPIVCFFPFCTSTPRKWLIQPRKDTSFDSLFSSIIEFCWFSRHIWLQVHPVLPFQPKNPQSPRVKLLA